MSSSRECRDERPLVLAADVSDREEERGEGRKCVAMTWTQSLDPRRAMDFVMTVQNYAIQNDLCVGLVGRELE
jgi:hypothetical protein